VSVASWLLLAAFFVTPGDEFTIHEGQIVARLSLVIPDEGAGASRARVRVFVEVSGPENLQVEGPRLEDALAAWQVRRLASSWRSEDGQTVIGVSFTLEQVKPGVVALPGVVLRARETTSAPWHDLSWPDLLNEAHDVPPIDPMDPQPTSPGPPRLGVVALIVAVALAVLFVARAIARGRRPRPVPLHVRALETVRQIEQAPTEALARLDQVVRAFLDERFGLNTLRQTAREMAASCSMLPEEVRQAVSELSAQAELEKFAGVAADEAQIRRAIELARRVIESRAALPVGQEEGGKENGRTASGG